MLAAGSRSTAQWPQVLWTAFKQLCSALQDTRSLDGRSSALSFLAKMLTAAAPPVPPLNVALPSLLAPGLKTSLAVREGFQHTQTLDHRRGAQRTVERDQQKPSTLPWGQLRAGVLNIWC